MEQHREPFPPGEGPPAELRPGEARTTFSIIGWGLFAFIMVQGVVASLLMEWLARTAPQFFYTSWWVWALNYVPLYAVAFPVMLLIWRLAPNRPGRPVPMARLSGKLFWQMGAACFAIIVTLDRVSERIAWLLSRLKESGEVTNPLETVVQASNPWLTLVVVAGVAPVMEELIFRYLLHKKLRCFGDRLYILVSATLFAAFHQNLYQMLYAFVLGAVFAYTVCRTGTTRYAVRLHMLVNLLGSGLGPLVLEYGNDAVLALYAALILGFLLLGVIQLVRWARRRPKPLLLPGRYPAPGAAVFANTGMVAFLGLTIFLTIRSFLR